MSRPNFKDYKQNRQSSFFPLDISLLIPENHLVRKIDEVIEGIDLTLLNCGFSQNGASSYHPKMMLKVIVYAYATKNYSSRKIAAMLRQDITYMWLAGLQTPDFNTVNRFRSNYFKEVLKKVFAEVLLFLNKYDYIKFENYFVDGTKLEADARKYSHVWKKNTLRYKAAVQKRVGELMEEINELNEAEDEIFEGKDLPELGDQNQINSEAVEEIAQKITNQLQEKEEDVTAKQTKKIKSKVNKLNKEKEKLKKYETQEDILGERNSYSKTDTDATMMRMKGTDELRPGYNAQVSSENQFVVNYTMSQNASDSADFTEHLETIVQRGEQFVPATYTGDAAYGSEENSEELKKHKIDNYLKYNTFHKEETGKIEKNIYHKDNFQYNQEQDFYICPEKQKLIYRETIQKDTINGYTQTYRIYEAEDCSNCPNKDKCTKSKGNRTVMVNRNLEKHKEIQRKNLKSEKGIELRKRRGFEIETFFGDLKHNQQYKRVRLRGLDKANTELAWLSIAYNLRKLNKMEQKSAKKRA